MFCTSFFKGQHEINGKHVDVKKAVSKESMMGGGGGMGRGGRAGGGRGGGRGGPRVRILYMAFEDCLKLSQLSLIS